MPLLSERQRRELRLIVDANAVGKRLRAADLQEALGVSQATIYTDLELLSTIRVCRSHGSIELVSEHQNGTPPRFGLRSNIKRAIAADVVECAIPFGAVTYLDTGSTCFYIADRIVADGREDVRLVTPNPFALNVCVSAGVPSEIVALGGLLRRDAASFHGTVTQQGVKQFSYDVAIISVDFVHGDSDVTVATFSEAEVEQKRIAIGQAKTIVVVADSMKLGRSVGHPVSALTSITDKRVTLVVGTQDATNGELHEELESLRRFLRPQELRVVSVED